MRRQAPRRGRGGTPARAFLYARERTRSSCYPPRTPDLCTLLSGVRICTDLHDDHHRRRLRRLDRSPCGARQHGRRHTTPHRPGLAGSGRPGPALRELTYDEDYLYLAWRRTAGGRKAITFGDGRVYWIAQNLAWHAYYYEDGQERELLTAIFEDGLLYAKGAGEH